LTSQAVPRCCRWRRDNLSRVAVSAATLDACAVLLPDVGDADRYEAPMTFAMARHAAVDLALMFRTRPAGDITLLEIIEAVDGPVEAGVPKLVERADPRIDRRLQAACKGAAEIVRWNLGRVSLAELVAWHR
jgi:hypothetical protein